MTLLSTESSSHYSPRYWRTSGRERSKSFHYTIVTMLSTVEIQRFSHLSIFSQELTYVNDHTFF